MAPVPRTPAAFDRLSIAASPLSHPMAWLACSIMLVATAVSLPAQVSVGATLEANSAMVWRGVTTTNRPVLNPTLTLDVPTRALDFEFYIWSNAEPLHFRPETMINSYGGRKGPLLSQHELSAAGAHDFGFLTAAVGASAYLYPRTGGLAANFNTVEARATVELPGAFAPKVTAFRDVGRVGGTYLEFAASHDVRLGARTFTAQSTAGVSISQGAGTDPDAIAYFARNGFTHVETVVSSDWTAGAATVTPAVHIEFANDPWARVTAPSRSRSLKLWVGTSINWKHAARVAPAASIGANGADDHGEKPSSDKHAGADKVVAARDTTR